MKNNQRSIRRYNTYLHAKKQLKIKESSFSISSESNKYPLGLFKKQNALDCGRPNCATCGNLRNNKFYSKKDSLTLQELRHLDFFDSQKVYLNLDYIKNYFF